MDKNLPRVDKLCGKNDHNLQKTPMVLQYSQPYNFGGVKVERKFI
jgi:hypothetical protein